jgi:hypothetical protein
LALLKIVQNLYSQNWADPMNYFQSKNILLRAIESGDVNTLIEWDLHAALHVRDEDISVQQIIDHHNYALANLAHPKNQIKLSLSSEV